MQQDDPEKAAEQAENRGDFQKAAAIWQHIAALSHLPEHFSRAGRALTKAQRWDEAQQMLHQALAVDEQFDPALESLAVLFLNRDDIDAQDAAREACSLLGSVVSRERSARALTLLGVAEERLGNLESARRSFAEALRLDCNYEEALYNLALITRETDPAKAAALLERALAIDPTYSAAHRELGLSLQTQGDLVAAEYHFRRAFELDSTDHWALLYLANLMAIQNDDSAEAIFRQAIEVAPSCEQSRRFLKHYLDSQVGRKADSGGPPSGE